MTEWTVPATVLRIVDADTIRLRLSLGWHVYRDDNCRLAGINAPELCTDAGKTARDYAAALLPVGAEVTFRSMKLDKYGRPLGHIVYQGCDVAAQLLAAGHCVPFMVDN